MSQYSEARGDAAIGVRGLRRWRWPDLPIYNGFTHEERVRGWQAANWLMDNGMLARPSVCSISGSREDVQYHSEDYYRPWDAYQVARPIHLALHRRFRRPDEWRRIVDQYAVRGDEWFCSLELAPVDIATQMRASDGAQVADLFGRMHEFVATRCKPPVTATAT